MKVLYITASLLCLASGLAPAAERDAVLETMKRATTFMTETVSYQGGYVWEYLPDLSRQWGEMEATRTMIWIQPSGTPAMGHLFLDAYHATGDETYYQAADQFAQCPGLLAFASEAHKSSLSRRRPQRGDGRFFPDERR